jgi:ribosomal protein S12 methylthiotransferase accessory factor
MALPRIPSFPEHLQLELVESQGVFLLTEEDVVWLGGALYQALVPQVDGRQTVEDIVEALEGQHPAAEVYYALERLAAKGYLREAESGAASLDAAWWHALGVSAVQAARVLASKKVSLVQVGDTPVSRSLREALESAGVRLVKRGGDLTLVVVDDYLRPALAERNREALASGRPWVLARLTGKVAWLGPRLVPGQTACWECLAQRLGNNRLAHTFVEERRGRGFLPQPSRRFTESTVHAAAHLLATSVARGLVTGEEGLASTLVTLDTVTLRTEHHTVVRRPQCPACGEPRLLAERQSRPVQLSSRRKAFTQDGGHRLTPPEETLRLYQHHVSPLTGVVQHLKQLNAGQGEFAPVIIDSGPNFARRSGSLEFLRQTLRGRSNGKGVSSTQARASGMCEAIERYCGVFQGDEARRQDTLQGLGSDAFHPHLLLGYSERQYALREEWNATHSSRMHFIPHRFEEHRRVEWSPVWSLTHGTTRYVPTSFCYFGYADPAPTFCQADSNGCAAGNSLEEAVLQGFLELAERDAVAVWWYNRVRRPRVDLESFDEPYFRRLTEYYRRLGRELWVLDLTNDLGLPTFAAISRNTERTPEHLSIGFGTHLEARIGILRALTEMNQFLPLLELAAAGGTPGESEVSRWLATASVAEHAYLAPAEEASPRGAAHFSRVWSEDLREDVEWCVDLARRHGLETLVLDQTRPDVGLSVVRVIVPGLRHMWPRLGPGRLYDIPVRLGWLSQPTPEEQLNPVGVFF